MGRLKPLATRQRLVGDGQSAGDAGERTEPRSDNEVSLVFGEPGIPVHVLTEFFPYGVEQPGQP